MSQQIVPVVEVQNGLIIKYGNVKYMTEAGEKWILSECKNHKYLALVLIMLDCGLRITEALNMKWMDFDFQNKMLTIYTIKEKGKSDKDYRRKDRIRLVPVTERLLSQMGKYWGSIKLQPKRNEYIFQSPKKPNAHISRKVVDRQLKKWMPNLSAHVFRHTFATKHVSKGTPLRTIQKLLGHDSIRSTEIYGHVPIQHLKESVNVLQSKSWTKTIVNYFRKDDINITPVYRGLTRFHIGRIKEMKIIDETFLTRTNLLIVGVSGIGKTHLTENLKHPNILRVDELKAPKKFLADMLLSFYRDEVESQMMGQEYGEYESGSLISEDQLEKATKNEIIRLAVGNAKVESYVQKQSIRNLLDVLMMATKKGEITLIIDDVTKITNSGINVLEKMKNHFHIIACARTVEVKKVSAFSNFKLLKIEPLSRNESFKLIGKTSQFFMGRIKDYHAYTDHIYRQTKGIPLYILEMVESFSKKRVIDTHTIRTEQHIASGFGYSLFPVLIMIIALTSVLRQAGKITGNKTDTGFFYALAAFGLITLYLARPLISSGKRKHI